MLIVEDVWIVFSVFEFDCFYCYEKINKQQQQQKIGSKKICAKVHFIYNSSTSVIIVNNNDNDDDTGIYKTHFFEGNNALEHVTKQSLVN